MRTIFLIAILLASSASAQDKPPRETGVRVLSQQDIGTLNLCIGRWAARVARVTTIPTSAGASFDIHIGDTAFVLAQAALTLETAQTPDGVAITIKYRHPYSRKAALKNFREVGKKCFREELGAMTGE